MLKITTLVYLPIIGHFKLLLMIRKQPVVQPKHLAYHKIMYMNTITLHFINSAV